MTACTTHYDEIFRKKVAPEKDNDPLESDDHDNDDFTYRGCAVVP